MTKFAFGSICGRRGNKAFLDVDRPINISGVPQCKAGMSPCSPATSLNNTICVEHGKKATDCPITDIVFTEDFAENRLKMESKGYEVIELNHSKILAFSRTANDNLPIT